MTLEEREYLRQKIADFRYSVVAELCNPYLEKQKKQKMIQEKASMTYTIPGSEKKHISVFKLHGKEGLLPKQREDRGRSRSISDKDASAIIKRLEENPELTATAVVKQLREQGVIENEISSSALSRLVCSND